VGPDEHDAPPDDTTAPRRLDRRSFLSLSLSTGIPLLVGGGVRGLGPLEASDEAPAALSFDGPDPVPVTLRVNGVERTLALEPRVTLLDALREHLGLTGTKKGCNHGECGACTVHLDGRRVNACLTLAVAASGTEVTTIEGLGRPEHLHPMQQAFIDQDAFQCGYCTPGQLMSAVACVREGHAGSPEEIREWMSGNICRCSAYPQIVAAVQQGARAGV
jgi:xanthine dehydrogenase YagT iron-sulfur-binding subunit